MAPAGWDTWGKIAILRDGFDASKWGEAWEKDLDAGPDTTVPGGAKDMFKALVGEDRGSKVCDFFYSTTPSTYAYSEFVIGYPITYPGNYRNRTNVPFSPFRNALERPTRPSTTVSTTSFGVRNHIWSGIWRGSWFWGGSRWSDGWTFEFESAKCESCYGGERRGRLFWENASSRIG